MGHEELDKLFRGLIQEDTSELNEQEVASKKRVWAALEISDTEQDKFPFWRIAAAVLLLLWGGTSYYVYTNTAQQQTQVQALEQRYLENQKQLELVKEELNRTRCSIPAVLSNPKQEIIAEPIVRYLDKIVEVHDTIWIEKTLSPEVLVEYVRDTVWIERPRMEEQSSVLAQLDSVPIPDTKKMPSKVVFIFGKQPLQTPTGPRIPLMINEHEIAKKTEQHNNGLITVRIN